MPHGFLLVMMMDLNGFISRMSPQWLSLEPKFREGGDIWIFRPDTLFSRSRMCIFSQTEKRLRRDDDSYHQEPRRSRTWNVFAPGAHRIRKQSVGSEDIRAQESPGPLSAIGG